MRDRIAGLFVPIATPFDGVSGDLDVRTLESNARALLETGIAGIVAAGSTGEAALLEESEFTRVVETLRGVVPDGRWLIAGTGRESTRGAIAASRAAARAGADAVLVRPPGYYGSSLGHKALEAHFRAVADAAPVPVLLYNIPKYTHVSIPASLFAVLTDHPNIVGAKDSSGDIKNFAAYRDAAPDWSLVVGSGSHVLPALELGGVGAVLAVANCAAPLAGALIGAYHAGNRDEAARLQETLGALNRLIVAELGVPGVKAAMDVVGLGGGPVRGPLAPLDGAQRERIAAALAGAGLVGRETSGSALG